MRSCPLMRLIVAAVLVLASVRSDAAVGLPPANEKWTKTTIDNLVIFSNASDRVVHGIADDLLLFRQTLTEVSKLQTRSPVPTYVFAFRNEPSYEPFRTAVVGARRENVVCLLIEGGDANRILVQADRGVDETVYHELTHYAVRNTVAGAPRWVNEGLSEFYSTLTPAAGSRSVRLGMPKKAELAFLQEHGLMSLPEMFQFNPWEHGVAGPAVDQYYAQCWLLAHYFLIGNPKRGAGLGEFLSLLDQGEPLAESFEKSFGTTMQEMLPELNSYLQRGRYNAVAYTLSSRPVDIPRPVEMPRDEIIANLGDLLLNIDPEKTGAETFLSNAIELNPRNALALADLAVFQRIKNRRDEAEPLFKRAVEAAGADPRPLIDYGTSLVSDLQKRAADGERIPPGDIGAVRQLARRASDLAPNDPNPFAILGATYTFIGEDAAEGIKASERAFQIAPARLDVAVDLILLYQIAGRSQAAKSMIARVIRPAGSADRLQQAQDNLTLGDFVRGVNLIDAGKPTEGQEHLQRASETVRNQKLKDKIVTIRVTKAAP